MYKPGPASDAGEDHPFVGLYRILRQGWALERAYDEARDIGLRWWYPAVKGELAGFARTLSAASVATAQ